MFYLVNMKRKLKFVSDSIKAQRKASKLSMRELSKITGISIGNLSKIESYNGNITMTTLFKIADALGMPTTVFLP